MKTKLFLLIVFIVGSVSFMYAQTNTIIESQTGVDKQESPDPPIGIGEQSNVKENLSVFVYPNPVVESFSVAITANDNAEVLTELFDTGGRLVISNNVSLDKGKNIISVDVSTLSHGYYFLKITDMKTEQKYQHKIYVQSNK